VQSEINLDLKVSRRIQNVPIGVGQCPQSATNAGCNALSVAKLSLAVLASFEELSAEFPKVHRASVAQLSVQIVVEVQINFFETVRQRPPFCRVLLVDALHQSHVLLQNVQNSKF
jgi:hypothetical protein